MSAYESEATGETARRLSCRANRRQRFVAIDKSVLTLPAPRRIRDRDPVKFVAKQPCLICGRRPADAHHLRFAQLPALGRKVSDEFTVPLCRGHHREAHHCGDEPAWWNKLAIDPTISARAISPSDSPTSDVRVDPRQDIRPHTRVQVTRQLGRSIWSIRNLRASKYCDNRSKAPVGCR